MLVFKKDNWMILGAQDISKRCFQVWHTCSSSCHSDFTSGCFLGMITNLVLQSCYHIVVMQYNSNVSKINGNFQAFSRQQSRRCLRSMVMANQQTFDKIGFTSYK